MSTHDPVAVLPAPYDYPKWVATKFPAFPYVHRATSGGRHFSALLELLDALVDAHYLRGVRRHVLQRENFALEHSRRYLQRLVAKDCQRNYSGGGRRYESLPARAAAVHLRHREGRAR